MPVLSNMTVLTRPTSSSIAGFFTMMPRFADREIAPMMATGTPMSSGHGVAMTTTARKRDGSPEMSQPTMPSATAMTVYQPPRRSAMRRIGGRLSSASRSTPTILA